LNGQGTRAADQWQKLGVSNSFVGAVVDDLEADGEGAGEVLPHGWRIS